MLQPSLRRGMLLVHRKRKGSNDMGIHEVMCPRVCSSKMVRQRWRRLRHKACCCELMCEG